MDAAGARALLDWIAAHPLAGGLVVFTVAFAESLAVVGLLVPGAALMIAFGAGIALGYLPFWPTVAWAAAGAVAGDGLSYWLGRRYHERLARLWPLSRHPELLERGRAFFLRHGGKSVALGRFVGPLRAVIPAVAGMMHMPVARFTAANVLSALAWAPLYLAPGIVLGLSLQLAAEVAGRLALVLLVLAAALWLLVVLVRAVYRRALPRVERAMDRLLGWSARHPVTGRVSSALVDPHEPELRGVAVMAVGVFACALGAAVALHALWGRSGPDAFTLLVQDTLGGWRTPWADALMGALARFATPAGTGLAGTGLVLWFAAQRQWKPVLHLAAALLLPALTLWGVDALYRANHAGPPPLGTLLPAVSVYAFAAVLLAREAAPRWRQPLYLTVAAVLGAAVLAWLYLGRTTVPGLVADLALGLAWAGLLGIGYRRHVLGGPRHPRHAWAGLALLLAAPLAASAPAPAERPAPPPRVVTVDQWRAGAWRELPLVRQDLRGARRHPLNVQWAARPETLEAAMGAAGWRPAPVPGTRDLLQWFNPQAPAAALPLLPQVHAGRHERLRWVREDGEHALWVLRLWPSGRVLADGTPLWTGSAARVMRVQAAGFTFLRTDGTAFDAARRRLAADLAPQMRWRMRNGVLLVGPEPCRPAGLNFNAKAPRTQRSRRTNRFQVRRPFRPLSSVLRLPNVGRLERSESRREGAASPRRAAASLRGAALRD